MGDHKYLRISKLSGQSPINRQKDRLAKRFWLPANYLIAIILHLGTYAKTGLDHDPEKALIALLRMCIQYTISIFTGLCSPATLLQTCDYCLDKAFVRAVIFVSKVLGPAHFPNGVFGQWPPEPPAELNAGFQPNYTMS